MSNDFPGVQRAHKGEFASPKLTL